MKNVTVNELEATLSTIQSCQNISIVTETIPEMNKKGNRLYGKITKVSKYTGKIGFFYPNVVNNQLGREDKEMNFKAQKRVWGVRDGVLVRHKDNVYLEIKVDKVLETKYFYKGKEVGEARLETIKGWLKERTTPKTQDALETKIIITTPNLTCIRAITMLGDEYRTIVRVSEAEKVERKPEKVAEKV